MCEIPGPEDGIDPRHTARRESRSRRKAAKKDRQLASEADIALRLALAELQDEDTHQLDIVGVEPAPDATHLRVLLAQTGPTEALDSEQFEDLLHRIEGGLRASIARAIHRKRTPSLSFVLVPRPAPAEDVESLTENEP